MGIIVDVNLLSLDGLDYIEIVILPSTYPVNFKGEYHYRSGSTKQQLRGSSLTEFLISKTGYKWDAGEVDNFTIDDLDNDSFDIFEREALRSGRMTKEDIEQSRYDLLEKLGLLVNGKLKRAAVLLFHKDPTKLITGCYIKIGKFGHGSDLLYQDELHGSLLSIADKIIELIYLKYLKAKISYDKEIRIETYPFPRDAVREAVYNALIHNNFADSIPIQLRIEDEAMYISNCALLPNGWSVDTLVGKHKSRPFNPDIANTFFRAGYVETWGRGILKIKESCNQYGTPEPEYSIIGNDITIKFIAHNKFRNSLPFNENLIDSVSDYEVTYNKYNATIYSLIDEGIRNNSIRPISDDVKKDLVSITNFIKDNEGINKSEIMKHLVSKSMRTIERYIRMLNQLSILEFRGAFKNGGYYITHEQLVS